MRKTKEILRLRSSWDLGAAPDSTPCGVGLAMVHEHLERASTAGSDWPLPEGLGEEELEARLTARVGASRIPILIDRRSICLRTVSVLQPSKSGRGVDYGSAVFERTTDDGAQHPHRSY
jgi:hypothetical protein